MARIARKNLDAMRKRDGGKISFLRKRDGGKISFLRKRDGPLH